MKRKLVTLLTLALTVSLLGGCGSEAGGTVSKGDTMTISEMFEALVADNGGEAMIFKTTANTLSSTANVGVSFFDGKTHSVYKEHNSIGEMMSGDIEKDDLQGVVHEGECLFYLVTDDDENILYETATELGFKFDGTNISRIDIDGTSFIVITTPRPNDSVNPNAHLLFPETESMVGKTIVMDSAGTEGIYVNLGE